MADAAIFSAIKLQMLIIAITSLSSRLVMTVISNCIIYNTRYTSTKTHTRLKTYLFMIHERFRRYSHLPHQQPDEEDVNIFENVRKS